MAGHGPAPKAPSKRRHHNPPASWGGANPTTATAASAQDRVLGIDGTVHYLVKSMWDALQSSAEARFYSAADWERARFELWHANELLTSGKPIGANSWARVQCGLSAMLISPAEKRRAAIEVRPVGPDADTEAAVSMVGKYQQKLQILKPSP